MKCHSCPEQIEDLKNAAAGGLAIDPSAPSAPSLAAVCGFLILNGCAAFEIRTTTTALSESGFLARRPETPKQREAYAALPPYKLHPGRYEGDCLLRLQR